MRRRRRKKIELTFNLLHRLRFYPPSLLRSQRQLLPTASPLPQLNLPFPPRPFQS